MNAVFCQAIFIKPFFFLFFKVGFLFFSKVEMQESTGQDCRSFSWEEVCVTAASSASWMLPRGHAHKVILEAGTTCGLHIALA